MEKETAAALCGALVGGGLTIAANMIQEHMRTAGRAEQLAHAIAGEVAAIMGIVNARGYLEELRGLANSARSGLARAYRVTAKRNFFSTIEANLDSIGLLPAELPILVPRFLTLGKAALEDFESISALNETNWHVNELSLRYSALADILEEAGRTGARIVTLVDTFYGSPHGRVPIAARVRLFALRVFRFGRLAKRDQNAPDLSIPP
jgi:hypothetical protein